jgi:hypothetical protein
MALTLGKDVTFAECLLMLSTKELTKGPARAPFAES